MSIIILSQENSRILKNVLMTDYEVSSSHASELIAALCGFKSYAALRAILSRFKHAPAFRVDFDQFEKRHLILGYDRSSAEWMSLSFNQISLHDLPFFIHTTTQKSKRDQWFHNCETRSIPFITIHRKNRYCYLEWDCMSVNRQFEAHVSHKQGDQLGEMLFRLYKYITHIIEPKSFYDGCAFYGNITKVSESTAKQLANEFFMQLTPWSLERLNPHSHSIVPGGLLV